MSYVFDTDALITLGQYPRSIFGGFWELLESYAGDGRIVSVHEARKEIAQKAREDLKQFAETHSELFLKPNEQEMAFVAEIFKEEHFQQLVGYKQLLGGGPAADPWVIAAGRVHKRCVVTQERHKKSAAKIPNVCEHFGIDCVNLEDFCAREGWQF